MRPLVCHKLGVLPKWLNIMQTTSHDIIGLGALVSDTKAVGEIPTITPMGSQNAGGVG